MFSACADRVPFETHKFIPLGLQLGDAGFHRRCARDEFSIRIV
jgi:hypothetical protein